MVMLVSSSDFWIEAAMKENNISNMKLGDKVEFTMDVAPGIIYEGKVRSIGFWCQFRRIEKKRVAKHNGIKGLAA